MSCEARFLPDPVLFEQALDAVPGWCEDAAARRFEPMESGGINANWHVVTRRGEFVLRLDRRAGVGRDLGVDRERELTLHAAAAAAGLAPPILTSAPDLRWTIRGFIRGRVWTSADLDSSAQRQRLGARLAVLHAQPVPSCPRFDPLSVVERYAQRLIAKRPEARASLGDEVARCRALMQQTGSALRAPAIVHSDLHAGNLVDDGRLWLLDWEYAQVGDPLCDLAGLIAHHPPLGACAVELLAVTGLAETATPAELDALAGVYRQINSLWQRCAWES